MTVETPAKGTPGHGRHSVPSAGTLPPRRSDPAGAALRSLAVALRSHGVEAREDGIRGLVAAGPPARAQSALLRPHRGHLWWWMRWPIQDDTPSMPSGVPISPVTRTSDAVRRIVGMLSRPAGDT